MLPESFCSSQTFCRVCLRQHKTQFDSFVSLIMTSATASSWVTTPLLLPKVSPGARFRDKFLRHKLYQNASQLPDIFLVRVHGAGRLKGLWTRVFWMRCELAFPECAAIFACTSHHDVMSVCSKIDDRNCHMKSDEHLTILRSDCCCPSCQHLLPRYVRSMCSIDRASNFEGRLSCLGAFETVSWFLLSCIMTSRCAALGDLVPAC